MDKLRAAVIGCGGIAQVHLAKLDDMPDVELMAVCDIRADRAEAAAARYGGKAYTDWRELLGRDDLDVVHLCTPHSLHAPMALDALAKGLRVLTEKPMASEVPDALAMAAADGGKLGVCFQNRFNGSVAMARSIVEGGEMGDLLALRGEVVWHRTPAYYAESGGWRGRLDGSGGGVLINQAIHTLDLMLWLGGPPETVSGGASTDAFHGGIEVEDSAHFRVTFANGRTGVFYATVGHAADAPVLLELTLEKGRLIIRGDTLTRTGGAGEALLYAPEKPAAGAKAYWGSGHGALIDDFYRCAREGVPFRIGGEEALPALLALKSVYRSSKERRPVQISEWRNT